MEKRVEGVCRETSFACVVSLVVKRVKRSGLEKILETSGRASVI